MCVRAWKRQSTAPRAMEPRAGGRACRRRMQSSCNPLEKHRKVLNRQVFSRRVIHRVTLNPFRFLSLHRVPSKVSAAIWRWPSSPAYTVLSASFAFAVFGRPGRAVYYRVDGCLLRVTRKQSVNFSFILGIPGTLHTWGSSVSFPGVVSTAARADKVTGAEFESVVPPLSASCTSRPLSRLPLCCTSEMSW